MTTDLMLHSTDEAFVLAERISKSALVPQAYRGKPADAAIAMLYGAEMGIPPMTALQRVVVINGKPSMDAQGLDMLIRQAGHSLTGDATADGATVTGKRCDNGDEMTVTWGPDDAKRAGLRNDTYGKFPSDMFWARAVSQLGRRLFADVLLSVSYVPEEAQAIPAHGSTNGHGVESTPADRSQPGERHVRQPPGAPEADPETGEIIVDADVVEQADPEQIAALKAAAKDAGYTSQDIKSVIDATLERTTSGWDDLSTDDAETIISYLGSLKPPSEASADYTGAEEPF